MTRCGESVLHYVEKAVASAWTSAGLRRVAIDETAAKRGLQLHNAFVKADIDSRLSTLPSKAAAGAQEAKPGGRVRPAESTARSSPL